MDVKELHDKILVYSNVFNCEKTLNVYANLLRDNSFEGIIFNKWRDWYTIGRICDSFPENYDDISKYEELYLSYDKSSANLLDAERLLFHELRNATQLCINDYINRFSLTVPEPNYITPPNLAFYNPDVDTDWNGHTMNYHSDYVIDEWWWPGQKFIITCTAYLNDDYDGGEIVFFANNKLISYKPKAGDLLVFPSGDPKFPGNSPYFHGVRMVKNGFKSIVRTYVKYWSNSNAHLWYSCKKLYGDEKWQQMLNSRKSIDNYLSWEKIKNNEGNPEHLLYSDLMKKIYWA